MGAAHAELLIPASPARPQLYEAARFTEAAPRFARVLAPEAGKAGKAEAALAAAGLGPLQLTPYRREFARALVVRGSILR
jgi:hypothetical protein